MDFFEKIRNITKRLPSNLLSQQQVYGALAGVFIFCTLISWSIESATKQHWSFGVMIIVVSFLIGIWATKLAISPDTETIMALVLFPMAIVLSAINFAGISYIIHTQKLALYEAPEHISFAMFRKFYLWVFCDMIPAVEIRKTLSVTLPVQSKSFYTGIPVLGFKIFVILYIFGAFFRWWSIHTTDDQIEEMEENASSS